MSEYERNKGKLTPVVVVDIKAYADEVIAIKLPDYYGSNAEWLMEEPAQFGHAVIGGSLYKLDGQYAGDEPEYCNITKNEDGTIDFESYHYNGGAHWTEVVEKELKRLNKLIK